MRISEKRGRCATPLLSFFVSPLTGATSLLLSLGCQIHSQENRYLWCFSFIRSNIIFVTFLQIIYFRVSRLVLSHLILLNFLKSKYYSTKSQRHLYDSVYKWSCGDSHAQSSGDRKFTIKMRTSEWSDRIRFKELRGYNGPLKKEDYTTIELSMVKGLMGIYTA